jgi:metal-responsive CopG/Arc/MetJ family transcriptional regulator
VDACNKKLISLRIREGLLNEFDAARAFTKLSNRSDMLEHAITLYIAYLNHQQEKDLNHERN